MLKEFYDDKTEAIVDISNFYGDKKHILDKCLILFSKEIYEYVLKEYECEQIGRLGACNGDIPIYAFEIGFLYN